MKIIIDIPELNTGDGRNLNSVSVTVVDSVNRTEFDTDQILGFRTVFVLGRQDAAVRINEKVAELVIEHAKES